MSYIVGQITVNTRIPATEGVHTEPLGYTDYNILDKSQSDTQTVAATMQNFARSVINNLTTNTYLDGIVRYEVSLNEEAVE